MKRILSVLVIFSFVFLFFVFTPKEAKATSGCLSQSTASDCDSSIYNCQNNVASFSGNNPGACHALGACYDYVFMNDTTVCFAKKNQPSTPPLECGKSVGASCCPAPDLCLNGLQPTNGGVAGGMCVCENPSNPFPTTVPAPPPASPNTSGSTSTLWCNDGKDVGVLNTAIGCITLFDSTNSTTPLLSFILKWAIGIAGGIAFILIVYAGFMIMTAQGNPERLKAGQELLTSAVSGLILLILSIFVLKFIGVDILGLAKFGFGQ